MTVFTKRGVDIFAPTDAAGNLRKVINGEVQVWSAEVERAIYYAMVSGNLAYATKADLDDDLAHDDGTVAWVVADTEALNGIYVKSGASGSGSWTKERNLPTGPQGDIGGVAYRFDAGTADADPGTGLIRANNADLSAATELYVSKSNRYGDDLSGFLATLAGSTSSHKGYLTLTAPDSETQAAFNVTGVTDATGYVKLSVSGQGGATAFIDAERLFFLFSRTGNAGDLNGVNPGTTGLGLLEANTPAAARAILEIGGESVVPVDDRDALKALDPGQVEAVYLKEADREGIFVWRSGDYSTEIAADTQEGIYIKADGVAATVGAWVRKFDGVYWFHWFGVVGDGTTDDQPAIQATIDTVQALGGGRLMGRVGAHRCADTVTVSGTAPITIQGATAAIPAFGESGDTDSSFTLVFDVADGTDGVVFENASTRIDGASLKDVFIYRNTLEAITGTGLTGGRGLKVLGVVNPRFENVHIHNFAIDFEVSDIAAGPTSGGSFDKIRCSTAARMQALIRGAIDVSFNDCIFGGREGGNTYNGLLTWSDHSRRSDACHFTNCMFIESGGVRPENNLRIINGFWNHFTGCVFERANGQHVRVIYDTALGASTIGAIFSGCHSNDPTVSSVLIDGEVSNIHLLNSRWHQSNAGASPNACVRIEHASKALTSHKILGCQIRFETYGGIRINNAQGVIVSNNSIYGSGSGDGIILHSNSEKCIATQNVFSGVGTAVNNIGTGNVVADNVTV
ncbi:hypothetical protein [Nitratireductor rhodophyticola]|uniref:right-handed parallel beta-helix repeat-containing protein n=1 Tax=Nitratireductor rhodophyticola TaxID=2854036 RepID=UPI003BAD8207